MVSDNTNARLLLRKFIEDKIREIAYLRYSERATAGSALEDWLYAESEVLEKFDDVRNLWPNLNQSGFQNSDQRIAS